MSSSSPKKLPAPTAQQPRTTAAERVVAAVAATTTKAKATTTTERSLAAEAAAIVQATKHKQASSSSSPAATTTTTTAAAKAATMTATTTQRRSTTTSTTTRTTASSSPSFHFHFPNFSEMVYQLLCFRCQHGHCDVPATEKPLGHWVEFVRSVYRKKRKDDAKAAYLTTERIQVLNSIGFTWASSSSSAGSGSGSSPTMQQERNDKLWEKHYQNLLAFKKEHGHCNVPQKTPLGRFVKNQRHQYKQRQLQLTTSTPLRGVMPTERFKKLQAIGFTWSVQPTKVTWEERFEELVEFKKRFGHTNVVQGWKENVPLGRWVMKQVCVPVRTSLFFFFFFSPTVFAMGDF